jgi:hypothetical protein
MHDDRTNRPTLDVTLPDDVRRAVAGAKTVGAGVSGSADDEWSRDLEPAIAIAREASARLVLADMSTRSPWTTPYGSGDVGADREGPYTDGNGPVSPHQLELLGRTEILRQVREAEAAGVETEAWLADKPGIDALEKFLDLFPIDVLVVPALSDPSLIDRIRGDELDAVRDETGGRTLVVVDDDGSVRLDRG